MFVELIHLIKRFFLRQIYKVHKSELPRGASDFNAFIESILYAYNLPNSRSYHFAIATMVMHMGPQETHKHKSFFAKALYKSMSNQVAFQIIQDAKDAERKEQEEQAKEAQAAKELNPNGEAVTHPDSIESGAQSQGEHQQPGL